MTAKKSAAKAVAPAQKVASTEEPKTATSTETPKSDTPKKEAAPNIIWKGKKLPPDHVKIGGRIIPLPSAEQQKKGFYNVEAGNIKRANSGYKFLKAKG